jgi:hypothetical protein
MAYHSERCFYWLDCLFHCLQLWSMTMTKQDWYSEIQVNPVCIEWNGCKTIEKEMHEAHWNVLKLNYWIKASFHYFGIIVYYNMKQWNFENGESYLNGYPLTPLSLFWQLQVIQRKSKLVIYRKQWIQCWSIGWSEHQHYAGFLCNWYYQVGESHSIYPNIVSFIQWL